MQIPQITFTRFLACLAIVVLHFGYFTWPMTTNPLANFRNDLINAMSYFFLLSGFILVISQARNETLPEQIPALRFWKRRAARILPVYFLALLLYFCLNFSYQSGIHILWQLQPYLYSLALLQSWKYTLAMDVNFPAWSLSVEAFFYFIFPIMYALLHRMKSYLLILFSLFIWLLNTWIFIYLTKQQANENFTHYFPLLHLATFLVGLSSGVLFVRNQIWLRQNRNKILLPISLMVGTFIVYTAYNDWEFHSYQHNGLLAPFFVMLIYCIALSESKLVNLFATKPFVFLGNISFAMYILQLPVYQLCTEHLPWLKSLDKELVFWPYLMVLIAFSSLIHVIFEQPLRKILSQ